MVNQTLDSPQRLHRTRRQKFLNITKIIVYNNFLPVKAISKLNSKVFFLRISEKSRDVLPAGVLLQLRREDRKGRLEALDEPPIL
jgi:hypothetical protein